MFVVIFDLVDLFFFFNDTATTEIYTLSLHDALPIFRMRKTSVVIWILRSRVRRRVSQPDRKSTRLNSSHSSISYAVFCLKKQLQYRPQNASTMALTRPCTLTLTPLPS